MPLLPDGHRLSAVRKTNRCNVQCKFCYNYGELDRIPPIGEGLWEIGGTKFYERDIDLLLSIDKRPTGIAYVYLEPFMEIEQYYGVIRRFHAAGFTSTCTPTAPSAPRRTSARWGRPGWTSCGSTWARPAARTA